MQIDINKLLDYIADSKTDELEKNIARNYVFGYTTANQNIFSEDEVKTVCSRLTDEMCGAVQSQPLKDYFDRKMCAALSLNGYRTIGSIANLSMSDIISIKGLDSDQKRILSAFIQNLQEE